MENFDWSRFSKKIAVKAEMSTVYKAWTNPAVIETWFLSDADYFNPEGEALNKDTNVGPNSSYSWSWYLFDVIEKGTYTQANGTDFLQFTFAGDCQVDIQLTQVGDLVMVELTQKNIPLDDQSKRGIRLGCDSGWAFFLVNLKSVLEGGLDLRNKDNELKGMLNN